MQQDKLCYVPASINITDVLGKQQLHRAPAKHGERKTADTKQTTIDHENEAVLHKKITQWNNDFAQRKTKKQSQSENKMAKTDSCDAKQVG